MAPTSPPNHPPPALSDHFKDFTSDLLVLKWASFETISKLNRLTHEDQGSVAVLCASLYFLRIRLFAVNSKKLGYCEWINYMLSSLIWITSFGYQSLLGTNQANMLANRRNIITESIAMTFLFARHDIVNPRYCTTEPCEHTFAGWRCEQCEATVNETLMIEDK